MRHTEVFVLLVFVTAALARNVDEPLLNRFRRRASKMTALWRKNNGMGTFRDAGTAGGNAISNEPAKPVVLECTTEGFFPQPGSCTNFYRCVDWLGTGTYFSTFKFNCPPGTVFDDDLDICNHPGAVRNPPECSGGLVILPSPVPPVVDTTTTTTITAGAETSSTAITEETTVSSQGTTGVTGSSGGSDGTTNQGGAGNSGNQGDSGSLGGSGGIGSPSIGGQEGAGSNQGGQNSSVNQGSVDGQGGSSGTSVSSQGETGVTGQGGSGGIGGGSETEGQPGDPESGNSGVQGGPGSIGGQDGSDGVGNQGAGGVGSIGGISGLGGQGGTDSSSAQEGSGGLGSSGASQGTQGVGSNPGVVSGGSIPGSEPTIIAPGNSPGAISGGSGGSNPGSEPTVISSGNDGNLGDIDSNGSASSQNGDGNTGNVGQGSPDVSISGAPGNVGGSGSTSDPSAVGSPDDFGGPGGVDSTESTGSSTSPSGSDGLEGTGGSGGTDGVSTSGVSSQGGISGVTEGAGAVSEAPTRPFSLECHQDNSYRRHPMYCNRYYYCLWDGENWTFPIFTCPAALVFDENSQQCSYPDDTEPCESSLAPFPTPETTTEVEMESTTFPTFIETTTAGKVWEIEESSVFPCPAPGYYPYEGDCLRFYKCVETEAGKLKDLLYKCPTGFGYSEERRRCARLEDLPPCDRSTEIAHERFDSATPLYPEDLLWFFKNRK